VQAAVRLRTPDGAEWELLAGDLIGRSSAAALQFDDAGVSEAHALVSLRGHELRLLGLRGVFSLGGPPLDDVALAVGQRLWLTPSVHIDVVEIQTPSEVLGLKWGDEAPRPLTGVTSLLTRPPRAVARFEPGAVARLWTLDGAWRLQVGDREPEPANPGTQFVAGDTHGELVAMPLSRLAQHATVTDRSAHQPLHLRVGFDAVHIHRGGRAPVAIAGLPARIVSELHSMGGSAHWEVVARELWSEDGERAMLRRRWDVHLARLRGRLRDAGVRTDLVLAHGTGVVELVRYPGDVIEDEA
jgi:hypothetical protein